MLLVCLLFLSFAQGIDREVCFLSCDWATGLFVSELGLPAFSFGDFFMDSMYLF